MRAHKEIRLQTLALVAAVTGVIGVLMFSLLTRMANSMSRLPSWPLTFLRRYLTSITGT